MVHRNNVWIAVAHIPGTENVQADREFRVVQTGMECKLNELMECVLLSLTVNKIVSKKSTKWRI